ncbi:hypothetical protein, partial [Mycoplasma sp. CSL10166]|uniref:hypothetical protein n=1 Tax=Mycoplasma sp. CSL10166 TaxID=2813825 RepID=UPI00197B4D74
MQITRWNLDRNDVFKAHQKLKKKNIIYIGFDTEFDVKNNKVISYQLSIIKKNEVLEHFRIVESNKINFDEFMKDIALLVLKGQNIRSSSKYDIVLLAHYSTAEISTFENFFGIEGLTSIDFGKYSNFKIDNYKFSFIEQNKETKENENIEIEFKSIKIQDTLNYHKASLDEIGKVLGFEKVDLQKEIENVVPDFKGKAIEQFSSLLKDPITKDIAIKYAKTDATITLYFSLIIYWFGVMNGVDKPKITTPALSEAIFIKNFISSKKLKWEDLGFKEFTTLKNGIEKKHWEQNKEILNYGTDSYKGARNQAYTMGVVNKPFYDFDLKGAYTNPLKLLPSITKKHLIVQDGKFVDINEKNNKRVYQKETPTLIQKEEYFKGIEDGKYTFNDLGTFKGRIKFKDDLKISPLLTYSENSLTELLEVDGTHSLVELYIIRKYFNDLVDWDESAIEKDGIAIFSTNKSIKPFEEYINWLTDMRNLHKDNPLLDLLFKLLANSFYGKLTQGINLKHTKNLITDENEDSSPSKISNYIYSAFITAVVRMLVFDAYKALEDVSLIGNIITDGIGVFSDKNKDELINIIENTDLVVEIKKMLNIDKLWELKHFSEKGHIIPKTRIDFPTLETLNNIKEMKKLKIASPSSFPKNDNKLELAKELNDIYLNNPDKKLKVKSLAGNKWVKNNKKILQMIEIEKTTNFNISKTRMIDEIKDGYITTKPFKDIESATKNIVYLKQDKYKNRYTAYNNESMVLLKSKQNETIESKRWIRKG